MEERDCESDSDNDGGGKFDFHLCPRSRSCMLRECL
jgi:hypothetical protein